MKNHELLDMIGEVNEDYVLEAGNNVTRPKSNWKTLAACAACAALVLAAYPVYRAVNPPLHEYTVVEGGGNLDTQGDIKAPAGDRDTLMEALPEPYVVGDSGQNDMDGVGYDIPGQDAPVQEEAQTQYQGLLRGLGGQNDCEPETYPDWFAGAWIDNDWPDNVGRLTVAVVDGFRTAELEAQILDWCGGTGDVLFCGAKYALTHLEQLQNLVTDAVTGSDEALFCGIGVDVINNCLSVDLYSDQDIPKQTLAKLARLDPNGDAIRVRVFSGDLSIADELLKGFAIAEPPVADESDDPGACPTPIDGSELAIPEFQRDYDVTFEDGLPEKNDIIPKDE